MKKSKLGIITIKKHAADIYADQLTQLLNNSFNISKYSFEENNVNTINDDLIILSTSLNYNKIKDNISPNSEIIIPKMTTSKRSIQPIIDLEKGIDAYLFNLSAEMAIDTITLLQHAGVNHINFIPAYPEMQMNSSIEYVITPGESSLIRDKSKHIIDIGIRLLDLSTIINIITKLDLYNRVNNTKLNEYLNDLITQNEGFTSLIKAESEIKSQLNLLLSIIDDYVLVTNNQGYIYVHCNKIKDLIGISEKLVGMHVSEIITQIDFNTMKDNIDEYKEYVLDINQIDTILEIRLLTINQTDYYIYKLRKFSQTESKQAKLRAKLYNKGHFGKYTFNNNLGESELIKSTIKLAKRMANSTSSVLIIGETGTGKELFAQAIHNASPRKDAAFVAVNCGIFNENLFESELFGYDDGSFTGAKKGGKSGLFEVAHRGTIFLDEIGELSLPLQAKLLRVIQEKQIRRVGSDKIIDIDIRIIAATNRDLMELVKQGKFRKDLYYRLNVLPLNIKPLRMRRDDILVIFEGIQRELSCNKLLDESAKRCLIEHEWDGNIRELRNVVEYLNNLEEKTISHIHLPEFIYKSTSKSIYIDISEIQVNDDHIENLILDILYKAYTNTKKMGRKAISLELNRSQVYISEQEVRKYLEIMKGRGLVCTTKGRGGTKITSLGISKLV